MTTLQNEALIEPFTFEEVQAAVKDLRKHKTPEYDGIPAEWLHEVWPSIEKDIVQLLQETFDIKTLTLHFNTGIHCLVSKAGTKVLITSYKPISVLTSMYKLMAKTIAIRAQAHLTKWIWPTQTGFVKNRLILDNVFTCYESMEWAQESKQNLVILLLDIEKAYDRVNWSFLKETMKKLGFSKNWINSTSTLYEGGKSSIIINRQKLEQFDICRGVK